ncbi:MAG: transposase [Candidatus Dormibacteria bacterium]
MLRLRDSQSVLWEELLPPEARLLSAERTAVDALLDDDKFLRPFVKRFACPIGRPTIPVESYLRFMYLKHRHGIGYETLVKEVSDSLSWRRFCRVRLDGRVPHSTTLLKLTNRFGTEIIDELNSAVLAEAMGRKLLRSRLKGGRTPSISPAPSIRRATCYPAGCSHSSGSYSAVFSSAFSLIVT